MKAARIAIAALLLLALGAARKYTSVRDDLMRQREAMGQAWQQVESVLEKRAELAPSLADAIKAAAKGGNPVYRDIEEARTALLEGRSPIDKIQANERLNMALSRLLLLSENYPQLRSNKPFARLESDLSNAENRIAVPRRKYNEALEHYNAQIQQFPDNVVASVSGFARNDAYIKTEPGEKAVIPGEDAAAKTPH